MLLPHKTHRRLVTSFAVLIGLWSPWITGCQQASTTGSRFNLLSAWRSAKVTPHLIEANSTVEKSYVSEGSTVAESNSHGAASISDVNPVQQVSATMSLSDPVHPQQPSPIASGGIACTSATCGCASCGSGPSSSGCGTCSSWAPTCLPQYCFNAQEYLCDGGDRPPEVRVGATGQPLGLDTQDTVVTYDNRDGNSEVAASNRACIYAPRFAAVRKVSAALQGEKSIAAVGYDRQIGSVPMEGRLPGIVVTDIQEPIHERLVRGPDAYKERNRAVPMVGEDAIVSARNVLEVFAGISLLETGVLIDRDLPVIHTAALAAEVWTGRDVVDVLIDGQLAVEMSLNRTPEELKIYEVKGHGRLRICKVADRGAAQVGDSVTFVLRVDNVGDGPVDNVVISDNLTTRLEYVDASQACTKGAIFAAKPNEAGSTTLQWQLTDDMQVGEGCIIRFRCKVR